MYKLTLLVFCLLLAACGATSGTAGSQARAPTTAPTIADAITSSPPISPPIDPARPCVRPNTDQPAPAEAVRIKARYDGGENTIVLEAGRGVTLGALSQALGRPDALRELSRGEWLLDASLEIEPDAELLIAAPEVRWLKLRSDKERFVAIKLLGGRLEISGACVTSWDADAGHADIEYRDGRGFILARDGGEMNISGAELRYLGYKADESFGLAWRMEGTRGSLIDSVVSHNYYGIYSYAVDGLVIRGNEVHHNVLYGIDPHTRSHHLRIEDNVVHNNGKHGIILADACSDGVVHNNIVFNNLHHGIVLYQDSNNNLVENNQTYNNGAEGININAAAGNTVRDNLVYDNQEAGIGVVQGSADNTLEANEIRGNNTHGVVLYSTETKNTIRANTIVNNQRYGIYVNSSGELALTENTISGNQIGVMLKDHKQPVPEDNKIYDNREGDIKDPTKDEGRKTNAAARPTFVFRLSSFVTNQKRTSEDVY